MVAGGLLRRLRTHRLCSQRDSLEGGLGMGACRLGLAVIAILTLVIATTPDRANAGAGQALATLKSGGIQSEALTLSVLFHHSRRVESYYCYPRNYWWFYRPYTTG